MEGEGPDDTEEVEREDPVDPVDISEKRDPPSELHEPDPAVSLEFCGSQ